MKQALRPLSIRISESELAALQRYAFEHEVTVSFIVRMAAIKLASKLGAAPRPRPRPRPRSEKAKRQQSSIAVRVYAKDIAAIEALKRSNNMIEDDEDAIRQSARAYWETRGFYVVDTDSNEMPPTEVCNHE